MHIHIHTHINSLIINLITHTLYIIFLKREVMIYLKYRSCLSLTNRYKRERKKKKKNVWIIRKWDRI